jgi:cell division protein ZapA (FtsZ GTPase activity inhibitor)
MKATPFGDISEHYAENLLIANNKYHKLLDAITNIQYKNLNGNLTRCVRLQQMAETFDYLGFSFDSVCDQIEKKIKENTDNNDKYIIELKESRPTISTQRELQSITSMTVTFECKKRKYNRRKGRK